MCKACQRKRRRSNVSGMNTKSASKIVMTGAKTAAGYAAANLLGRVPIIAANPTLRAIAPLAGAVIAKSMLGKKGDEIAIGMAVNGVIGAVQTFAPGVASQAGLGGAPYKSNYIPGISGRGGYPSVIVD